MDMLRVLLGLVQGSRQVMLYDLKAHCQRVPGRLGNRRIGSQAGQPFAMAGRNRVS
jgi:hypothetical protein